MFEFAVVEDFVLDKEKWLEALPARTFKTDVYGDVPVTIEDLDRMVQNFKSNVRGQQIAINFDHGQDKAKGNQAAGWYKDFDIRPSSADPNKPALFANVAFVDDAASEIEQGKWKYFSLEWEDEWMDNDGNKHQNVIVGGALTNRPIAKNMLPINFSEAMGKDLKKEELEKAVSNSKATRFFSAIGVEADEATVKAFNILEDEFGEGNVAVKPKGESKEWEHSEPGTGSPPIPKTEEDGSDDPAIEGGWRRDTPGDLPEQEGGWVSTGTNKTEKGGNEVPEDNKEGVPMYEIPQKEAQELLRTLDLPVDAKPEKVLEATKLAFGELTELKSKRDAADQEKEFSEKYPDFYDEHNKLMERDRKNSAHNFSESVKTLRKPSGKGLVEVRQGLSKTAIDKIEEVHMAFAEGTATSEDFEECVKTIVHGGIVEFGEIGTDKDGKDNVPIVDNAQDAKKAFSELMNKAMAENPEWDAEKALAETANKHPDLFEQSRQTIAG
jgi:hypothetical protein